MNNERKYGVFAYWSEDFQEWKVFGQQSPEFKDSILQVFNLDEKSRKEALYDLEDEHPTLAGKIEFIEIPYMLEYARNKD